MALRPDSHRRPNHRVLAVLASAPATVAASAEMATLGLETRELEVLHGDSGMAVFDARSHRRGVRTHIARIVKDLGGVDVEGITSYREALSAGQYVMSVHTPTTHSMHVVVGVLQRHGARDMRFFGAGTMETIPDDYPEQLSNPSGD